MEYSVIIPVYNSAPTLYALVTRLAAVTKNADRCEVILINDGSRDESWQVIRELAQEYPWVRGIDLMRNYGQHNALLAGIRQAECEVIVTIDDDLQHPPEEIPKLLAKLSEGYDLVYGVPQIKQHNFWRVLASALTRLVLKSAVGSNLASSGSSFRAFRTRLRDAFANYESPFVALDVLLVWGTSRIGSVLVRHEARYRGKSAYSFLKLVILAVDVTTGFSIWPLRLSSFIGFLFTLIGVCVFLYTLILYLLEGGSVPNLRFIGSIIAIFSGAQLFALGIMGEYLARIHQRMMGRPAYIVSDRTTNHSDQKKEYGV